MEFMTMVLKRFIATLIMVITLSISPQVFAANSDLNTKLDYSTFANIHADEDKQSLAEATNLISSKTIGSASRDVFQASHEDYKATLAVETTIKTNSSAARVEFDVAASVLASKTTSFNGVTITDVANVDTASKMAAGLAHTLTIKDDGTLWAWGYNEYGQLGDVSTKDSLTQVQVMSGVKSVAAGSLHTAVIKENGTLWTWGSNEYGQLGDGSTVDRLNPLLVMSEVKYVAAGYYQTFAIKEDGTLWAWGSNDCGQLGDNSTTDRVTPVQVMSGVKSVAVGLIHTLVIKEDGTLWTWGSNEYGQLGDSNTTGRAYPMQVSSQVKSVAAGGVHSLAIKDDWTLWAWGGNEYGQLGDFGTNDRVTPIQVLSEVKSVTAGFLHSVVIKEDGRLWAWGRNNHGQLGTDSGTSGTSPARVWMPAVKNVVAGYFHTMAKENGGTLQAWGYNIAGQLGIGTTGDRFYHEKVITCNSIYGLISLPAGVIAPAGGIGGYVSVEPKDGGNYYSEYFSIPAGDSSTNYAACIPEDVSTIGYRVGYKFYTDQNYSEYVREGYYSLSGTKNYYFSTLVDISEGNVAGVNLTLLKGNTISGTIFLPIGREAPSEGIMGRVQLYPENSNDRYFVYFNIPAGGNSVDYSVTVAEDSTTTGYYVCYKHYWDLFDSGYVVQGYYSPARTTNYNLATLVNTSAGNVSGVNLTLLTGNTISGTITLPEGVSVPYGRVMSENISVVSQEGGFGYVVGFKIDSGYYSANYRVTVPGDVSIAGFRVGYMLGSDLNNIRTVKQGYFSSAGTTNYNSAAVINLNAGNVTGINMKILKGNTITGKISLPAGVTAPFGGIEGNVTFEPQKGGSNYVTKFMIPSGGISASYTVALPGDDSITGYRVGYTFIDNHFNYSEYLGNGYYSTGGTTNYNSATFVDVRGGDITKVNLTLLTKVGIPDDRGNTIDSATEISLGSNISGQIDYSGDIDYFKVVCPSTGTYIIKTQSNIDTYGYLYNSSGTEIARNDSAGADGNFSLTAYLQAGQQYYVKVRHFSDGTGSYNIRMPMNYSATPLVQMGINPNDGYSAGIFVGLKDIKDTYGNLVQEAKLADYQIEIYYDYLKIYEVYNVVDIVEMGKFTKKNNYGITSVFNAVDAIDQGTSNFQKLFFASLELAGTSTDNTDVTIKFVSSSDSHSNNIKIPTVTLNFKRGKILNEASQRHLSTADAVAGLQYLAKIVDSGFDLGKVNLVNMASILNPEPGDKRIEPSVRDVVALLQKLAGLRDDSFQLKEF